MLNLVRTLFAGASARTEDTVRDHFAVDLLDQKVREAEHDLENAKATMASLIMRERNEKRGLQSIQGRIADLEARTIKAMEAGRDDLAKEGAAAIAELQNEADIRSKTVESLTARTSRMQMSVEKMHRRIVDLKQGMIEARALDAEHAAQRKMNRSIGSTTNVRDAEALIARIKGRDDPFEEDGILEEIDDSLTHASTEQRMAEAGFGEKSKITADDVLSRLGNQTKTDA